MSLLIRASGCMSWALMHSLAIFLFDPWVGAVARIGVASFAFTSHHITSHHITSHYSWWMAGVAVGSGWNLAMSSVFTRALAALGGCGFSRQRLGAGQTAKSISAASAGGDAGHVIAMRVGSRAIFLFTFDPDLWETRLVRQKRVQKSTSGIEVALPPTANRKLR